MMNLDNLINKSGELTFDNYYYSNGVLNVMLNIVETDINIKLRLRTNHLSFDSFYLEKKEDLYRTCRIEIQELINVISVENGIYVPPSTFGALMKESRSNYNLSYGKKAVEARYIFSLVGYGKLVSCLLLSLENIEIVDMS